MPAIALKKKGLFEDAGQWSDDDNAHGGIGGDSGVNCMRVTVLQILFACFVYAEGTRVLRSSSGVVRDVRHLRLLAVCGRPEPQQTHQVARRDCRSVCCGISIAPTAFGVLTCRVLTKKLHCSLCCSCG